MTQIWGYSSQIDVFDLSLEKVQDRDNIIRFVKELVRKIDMKAFGEPIVERFGEGDKFGYSLVQLIMTSCITAHFVELINEGRGKVYLEVFSCKDFEVSDVLEVVKKYFSVDDTLNSFKVNKTSR